MTLLVVSGFVFGSLSGWSSSRLVDAVDSSTPYEVHQALQRERIPFEKLKKLCKPIARGENYIVGQCDLPEALCYVLDSGNLTCKWKKDDQR